MGKRVFIVGIGTDVGKTVVAAIWVKAFETDYWKPVQTGSVQGSDAATIQALAAHAQLQIHPEAYCFTAPLSPHAAAALEGVEIAPFTIKCPETTNQLIVEGAGGLMVPLNRQTLLIDMLPYWAEEVILVSKHYLGSINHTLLSAQALYIRQIPVKGIVFVGHENRATEQIILEKTGWPMLQRVPWTEQVNASFVAQQAYELKQRYAKGL